GVAGGVLCVVTHVISGRGAEGGGACAKTYHRKGDGRGEPRAPRREGLRDGGAIPVVKQQFRRIDRRQPTVGFADTLPAVKRGPVLQETELAVRRLRDLGDAEETAHRRRAGLLDDAVIGEKDEGDRRGERQRRTPEQRARGQERGHGPVERGLAERDRI